MVCALFIVPVFGVSERSNCFICITIHVFGHVNALVLKIWKKATIDRLVENEVDFVQKKKSNLNADDTQRHNHR